MTSFKITFKEPVLQFQIFKKILYRSEKKGKLNVYSYCSLKYIVTMSLASLKPVFETFQIFSIVWHNMFTPY